MSFKIGSLKSVKHVKKNPIHISPNLPRLSDGGQCSVTNFEKGSEKNECLVGLKEFIPQISLCVGLSCLM